MYLHDHHCVLGWGAGSPTSPALLIGRFFFFPLCGCVCVSVCVSVRHVKFIDFLPRNSYGKRKREKIVRGLGAGTLISFPYSVLRSCPFLNYFVNIMHANFFQVCFGRSACVCRSLHITFFQATTKNEFRTFLLHLRFNRWYTAPLCTVFPNLALSTKPRTWEFFTFSIYHLLSALPLRFGLWLLCFPRIQNTCDSFKRPNENENERIASQPRTKIATIPLK